MVPAGMTTGVSTHISGDHAAALQQVMLDWIAGSGCGRGCPRAFDGLNRDKAPLLKLA
jgi:hypothetical protein